jgi:phenylacetate-CoA ligase
MFWSKRMETLGIRTDLRLVEPGKLPGFKGKAKRVVDRRGVLF